MMHAARARGFTLIPTLILLLTITLLGNAAAQWVMLASRSTHADRQYQIALQAARAALDDGLRDALRASGQAPDNHADVHSDAYVADTDDTSVPFGQLTGQVFPSGSGMQAGAVPRYRIEHLASDASLGPTVRITGIGVGPLPSRVSVLLQVDVRFLSRAAASAGPPFMLSGIRQSPLTSADFP